MKVIVPATTANVGPGFDCLGISLKLYNRYVLRPVSESPRDRQDNLADLAYAAYYKHIGASKPHLYVDIEDCRIPSSRGLGSSASLIVAGLVLGNQENGERLSDQELLELATEIEGHPDNVAPAILGGLVVSDRRDRTYYSRMDIDENLHFIAFIPDYKLSTEEARRILPDSLSRRDAVSNIANTAMILSKLMQRDYRDLSLFFEDRIHEPYRKTLIRDYEQIKALEKEEDVLGVYLSGAGPTMMVLARNTAFLDRLPFTFQGTIEQLTVDPNGYQVL